jgi:4-diphosphocytidyl-2-C-methyl-D-erythritol kinase
VNARAPAKLNLALVVGPRRSDGKHEVATVLQRIDLADGVSVEPREGETTVEGFPDDTLVAAALAALGAEHGWRARIEKRIPVAAGLGGGSSDAATALRLGNAQLKAPHGDDELHRLAAGLGADVPFFLREGPQLGTADGTALEPVALPQDYTVCLLLPDGAAKSSTREVYAAFDERRSADGFDDRAAALRAALAAVGRAADLAHLPPNDLASSRHASTFRELGAFRADVSGAGPVVYALFDDPALAERARAVAADLGEAWIAGPAW